MSRQLNFFVARLPPLSSYTPQPVLSSLLFRLTYPAFLRRICHGSSIFPRLSHSSPIADEANLWKLGSPRSTLHVDSCLEKPFAILFSNVLSNSLAWIVPDEYQRLNSSTQLRKQSLYVKASQNTSDLVTNADKHEKNSSALLQKKNKSNFPSGFQTLVENVCDQTEIAELKLKVGDFEMLMKREAGISKVPQPLPAPIESPVTAPSTPSKPMDKAAPSPLPVVDQKPTSAVSDPFSNISAAKTSKLSTLEAAYVLVSSSMVGLFRKGRTLKGKRQPPSCKEGDFIKEGQIIGFLDQFGNEVHIRSDVSGEVLKILYEDGEAVGYGDPLVAVLPSFHGIK